MLGSPTAAMMVGSMSSWAPIWLILVPGLMTPGHLISTGDTIATLPLRVLFTTEGIVVPPSGQENVSAPLSVEYMTMVLSAMPRFIEFVEQLANMAVMFHHAIWVDAASSLAVRLFLQVCEDMHASRVPPDEEWLVSPYGHDQ